MAKTKPRTIKKSREKRGQGKPKRIFTDAQMQKMGKLAFEGCKLPTIARLMDLPLDTLESRKDIQEFLSKNRARRYSTLRKQQNKSAKDGNVTMQIWLGKNCLGQADKTETKHGLTSDTQDFLKYMGENYGGLPK